MLPLLLGAVVLFVLLGAARGFSRAQVVAIKMLLAWIAALAGLAVALLLLLTGRGAAAFGAAVLWGPLLWGWWRSYRDRTGASIPPSGARAAPGRMSREEALQVLGLRPGASEAEIRAAWLKVMRGAHPDSGGSDWLAARVNQARDVLLPPGMRRG